MSGAILDIGNIPVLDPESGHFINGNHQRIAEIINDWNPDVYLCWIPPDKREGTELTPYAVIHMPPGKPQYVIFTLSEEELDERVLERLWTNDTTKHNVLSALEAREAAAEAVRLKKQMDEREEQKDFALSVLKSGLHTYRHNGKKYT